MVVLTQTMHLETLSFAVQSVHELYEIYTLQCKATAECAWIKQAILIPVHNQRTSKLHGIG